MSGFLEMPKPSKSRRIRQAKYDETCNVCLQDIHQGDSIEMTDAGVVHFGCAKKEGDGEEGE